MPTFILFWRWLTYHKVILNPCILTAGHKAYIGFLYLEYTYNNPVVNMFVKLLMDAVSTQGQSMARHLQEEFEEVSVFPKQQDPLSKCIPEPVLPYIVVLEGLLHFCVGRTYILINITRAYDCHKPR